MDENNLNNRNNKDEYQKDNLQKRKKKKVFTKIIIFGSCALVLGILGGVFFQVASVTNELMKGTRSSLENQLEQESYVNENPIEETKVLDNVELENSVTKVYANNINAIVAITSIVTEKTNMFGREYSQDIEGAGSGIIIEEDKDNLYIVTNSHVVTGAKSIMVTFGDKEDVKGVVKGTDTAGDLAVVMVQKSLLKDSTKKQIKIASLGESSESKVGDRVITIGNALGLGQSATVGYISAVDREINAQNGKMTLIQTDAAINGGNSGGALLNMKGEVIGINSSKIVNTDIEGIGFSIPVSNAKMIIKELMAAKNVKKGKEGYLGIGGTAITSEESTKYNMPSGVYVSEIPKKSAADKAGILVGDIITKLNGVGVSSVESLVNRANSYEAGTTITLTVERYQNGEYQSKELKLVLMSKKDFDALEYSKNTNLPDDTKSDDNSGSMENDDMEEFYRFFEKYFQNRN